VTAVSKDRAPKVHPPGKRAWRAPTPNLRARCRRASRSRLFRTSPSQRPSCRSTKEVRLSTGKRFSSQNGVGNTRNSLGNCRKLLGKGGKLLGNGRKLLGSSRKLVDSRRNLLGSRRKLVGKARRLLGNRRNLPGSPPRLVRAIQFLPAFHLLKTGKVIRTQRVAHFIFFTQPLPEIDELAPIGTKWPKRLREEVHRLPANWAFHLMLGRHCSPLLNAPFGAPATGDGNHSPHS